MPAAITGSRSTNCRQFKLENRPSVDAWRCPNPPVVVLDNRMADGKSHSHPKLLGREKWAENSLEVRWLKSCPGIFDRHMNKFRIAMVGFHFQHARPDRLHRFNG